MYVKDLSSALTTSSAFDLDKADFVAPAKDMFFDMHANLNVPKTLFGFAEPMPLNDWAHNQVCEKLSVPSAYAHRCPPDLRADNFNHWLKKSDKNWMVRSYQGNVRASLSSEYVPVSSTEVIEMMIETLGDATHVLVGSHVDSDNLYAKSMTMVNEPGTYGMGVCVSNGEVGNRMLEVSPFVLRTSCWNSIVIKHDMSWAHRHIHATKAWLRGTFKEMFGKAMRVAPDVLEEIVKAELDELPNFADVVEKVCKEHGFLPLKDLILIGSEAAQTRMGLVNGLSFAAQQTDNLDTVIGLEALAGKMLMKNYKFQMVDA